MLRISVWFLGALACLGAATQGRADVTLATWTTGSGSPITANGSLNVPTVTNMNLTLTTPATGNAGTVFTTNWGGLGWTGLSSLGTITSPTNSSIGIGYLNSATNTQTIRSTVVLNQFYMFFDYVDNSTYDFSNWSGSVQQVAVSNASQISLSGKTVTVSGLSSGSVSDGFALYFSGATLAANTNFQYNINSSVGGTAGFSFGVAVPEPGTLLLGGIAAACGGTGVWFKRRKKAPVDQPAEEPAEPTA
jgi:hypothetical protein